MDVKETVVLGALAVALVLMAGATVYIDYRRELRRDAEEEEEEDW